LRTARTALCVLLSIGALMALSSCEWFYALFGEAPNAVLIADPTSGAAPLEVAFNLSGSTVPGGLQRFRLDFGDGSDFATGTEIDEQVVHTYAVAGTYTAALEVTSRYGQTDHDTEAIVVGEAVEPGGEGPVAVLAADTTLGDAPFVVSFDVSLSSAPGGSLVSFRLDFGDGTAPYVGTNFSQLVIHLYAEVGLHTATLTVADANGDEGTATLNIVATTGEGGDEAPVAAFDWTPAEPFIGDEVTFDAGASTDPASGIVEPQAIVVYTWEFGDGAEAATTAETVDHTYTWPGTYLVTLTVYDDDGVAGTDTGVIDVHGAIAYVSDVYAATVSELRLPGDGLPQVLHYTGDYAWGVAVSGDGAFLYVGGEETGVGSLDKLVASTGTVVAQADLPFLPTEVAVHPDGDVAYGTEDPMLLGGVSSVWAIDPTTLAVTATIPVQSEPVQIRFTPSGDLAYVTCYEGGTLDEIDTVTHTVVDSFILFPAVGWPWGLAITSDGAHAVVTFPADDKVALVRLTDGAILAVLDLGLTSTPVAVALTSDDRLAYVTDYNQEAVHVVEVDTGAGTLSLSDTIALDNAESLDIAITPEDTVVLVPHGYDGWQHWLSVIEEATGTVDRRSAGSGATYVDVWGIGY